LSQSLWGLGFVRKVKCFSSFEETQKALIDMMLVPEPLYLYFIDSDKTVIEVRKAEPWSWNHRTWKFYRSEKPYRYLLESFEELDIDKDDKLEFEV